MQTIIISNLTVRNSNAVVDILRAHQLEYDEVGVTIELLVHSVNWSAYRDLVADIVMNTSARVESKHSLLLKPE